MKKHSLLYIALLLQVFSLQAQQNDVAVREFADKKVPPSICCGIVSFSVSLITISDVTSHPESNIRAEEDSIAENRFSIKLNNSSKEVDSVTQYFEVPEGESGYNAKVYMMEVKFKSKAFRDAYLKKLGDSNCPW